MIKIGDKVRHLDGEIFEVKSTGRTKISHFSEHGRPIYYWDTSFVELIGSNELYINFKGSFFLPKKELSLVDSIEIVKKIDKHSFL